MCLHCGVKGVAGGGDSLRTNTKQTKPSKDLRNRVPVGGHRGDTIKEYNYPEDGGGEQPGGVVPHPGEVDPHLLTKIPPEDKESDNQWTTCMLKSSLDITLV